MNVVEFYRSIEVPSQSVASPEPVPETLPLFNAHVHLPPNFSAFDTVDEVVAQARSEQVRILGVTNYYDHRVYDTFCEQAAAAGLMPLFGLEVISQVDALREQDVRVNDPNNPGRMYLCGKAISHYAAPPPRAAELLAFIRASDRERMAEMLRRLSAIFVALGIPVGNDVGPIVASVAARCGCPSEWITLQERHIARAMQEQFCAEVPEGERAEVLGRIIGKPVDADALDPVSLQGTLRSALMKAGKPAFVEERFVSFEEATELILGLGGIPCYPTLADGADPRCQYEADLEGLVRDLQQRGIHAAEFIPVRNQPDVLEQYVKAMRAAGMVVVVGTEHNTLDRIPLDPQCKGGVAMPASVREIAYEGACVCVAHHYCVARGELGYVGPDGAPAPGFDNADARIAHFAALGRAVMAANATRGAGR